jgi:hypothetical protein
MTTRRLTLLWLSGTGFVLLLIGARLAFPDAFTNHAGSSGASNRPATSSQPVMGQPSPLGALPQPGSRSTLSFSNAAPSSGAG